MGRVWLVRHAPVTASGVCYGQSDVPTALDSHAAADEIADRWRRAENPHCDELWCSPWERTRSVAEELARRWAVPCRADARLSELCFGEWEGRSYADIERDDAGRFSRWMKAYETAAPPGGEALPELVRRVTSWLEDVGRRNALILAVTHAGVIRVVRTVRDACTYAAALRRPVEHLVPEQT
jgi:alpha-ribazole phosphatase